MDDFHVGHWRYDFVFDLWMTLKRKITHSNVISVPELVKNELLHQILGLLCQKLKNKNNSLNVGGHLGFGGHFECFLIIFVLLPGTNRFSI